jgi:hypothetical protein
MDCEVYDKYHASVDEASRFNLFIFIGDVIRYFSDTLSEAISEYRIRIARETHTQLGRSIGVYPMDLEIKS